jgi:hypothetical protein
MVAMAHRSRRRKAPWRVPEAGRPPSLGTHWRADGAPKTSYRSQRDALSAADERRQESGADLNVYCCDFCGAWHMGNRGGRGE